MGSAMAALRSKESNRLSSDYSKTGSDISDTAGENTSQSSSLRMRLDMALHDLETNQANLELERQRVSVLLLSCLYCRVVLAGMWKNGIAH